MKKTQETLRREDSTKEAVLHLAFELRILQFRHYFDSRLLAERFILPRFALGI